MTRNTWAMARACWRRRAGLGVLIVIVFLAHDLGMASMAAYEEFQHHPRMVSPSSIRVLHIPDDRVVSHNLASHTQHGTPDAPVQSECEISRAAVTRVNDTFDTTVLESASTILLEVAWHDALRSLWVVGVTYRSSRDQRTLFQVFLI